MAMEKQYVIRETHTRSITALGYNPARREILMGCEDGVIKVWEAESGKLLLTSTEHGGWVTDFLFWARAKLMLSAANDGFIVAWGSGGALYDKIQIGVPVYCLALNPRRHQLVCGVNGGIRVYSLDENKECGHVVNNRVLYVAREHTDIVRNIVCYESRIYSAGYDKKLVIYDSSYTGDNSLEAVFINPQAHDAGISCLLLARDNENNTWILTGSFDKSVKIWSLDGKLVHKLDNFTATVTGICYVPRNKTVWAAGGMSYASLFDPKSGDNVSDFIGTFQNQEEEKYQLHLLQFFPELNQVVASTSRRHLVVWKYHSSGCITALKCKAPLESLCYTRKVPILIFSGDNEGVIMKWERMQSNHFMYSKELFLLSDSKLKKKRRAGSKARELMIEQQMLSQILPPSSRTETASSQKSSNKNITSHYAFNKPMIPPVSTHNHPNTTILKIVFVESLDFILAASEDSNIYVWGFDEAAVEVLRNMKPQDLEALINKYAVLLDSASELLPKNTTQKRESDSVTNRVAGFVCKFVFSEHMSCVTSLVAVGREHGQNSTYVLSGGWDRRICIWDLEKGRLHDNFRAANSAHGQDNMELACDGVILCMDYSPSKNEFAYASSDKMVYIRKFSTDGSKMTLVNTLQGHDGEITCVQWNPITSKWVTGSEDGTVRIWSGSGMNECETILSVQGGVACLCMDKIHGAIVAGIQNTIRVYEAEFYRLVQSNLGHTESVRSIIHIPERNQYVSCSWDKTIRVWNAWKLPRRRKQTTKMSEKRKNSEDGKQTVPDGKADDDGKGEKLEGMSEEEEEEEAEDMKETSPAAGEERQKEE
ncbi:uncharacterized WD repeat-containing protein alr3466-like [Haliotis rufescens]|uniref:uncharacterized WD repeat-containing protein alr3466-like n=1 Tax=Haliotis rufescens TaxID=6454 RepID=UPI00201F7E59|nr:uncharacterized WD repeat-containing protein alr3466-like [Haliotis rufescens]